VALDYLAYVDDSAVALAVQLFESADNLTDRLAGIRSVIKHGSAKTRDSVLDRVLQAWRDEALVVNQWFSMQAIRPASEAVEEVERLAGHEAFDWRNPNKVRALIGAFATANLVGFHRADGAGYRLLADAIIKLQADNPQIAARLCTPLTRYRRYAIGQENMRAELGRIARVEDLSRDVYEVVERALAG
jgi:aminopeptidase N